MRLSIGLAVVALGLTTAASFARAQAGGDVARAEALFHEGVKLMEAGKLDEACPKLESSQRLVKGLGTTLYLAACYERSGKTASAWAQFRQAESLASARGDKRAAIAHERAEALEAVLPKVKLALAPEANVAGLEIREDGSVIDKAGWGVEVPIDPGPHTVSARAPHKTEWSTTVNIPAAKGTTAVAIPALEDEPAAAATGGAGETTTTTEAAKPAEKASPSRGGTQRLIGLATAGVGVVGIGIGTVFGLQAKSKFNDSDAHCRPDDSCDSVGYGLRGDGMTAATISTIAFGVGAAAVAGGLILYFTAPRGSTSAVGVAPSVGPGAAGLSVRGVF